MNNYWRASGFDVWRKIFESGYSFLSWKINTQTVHFLCTKMKQRHLSLVYTSWGGADLGIIRGPGRWMEDSKYYTSLQVQIMEKISWKGKSLMRMHHSRWMMGIGQVFEDLSVENRLSITFPNIIECHARKEMPFQQLSSKDIMWRQKSRCLWFKAGTEILNSSRSLLTQTCDRKTSIN